VIRPPLGGGRFGGGLRLDVLEREHESEDRMRLERAGTIASPQAAYRASSAHGDMISRPRARLRGDRVDAMAEVTLVRIGTDAPVVARPEPIQDPVGRRVVDHPDLDAPIRLGQRRLACAYTERRFIGRDTDRKHPEAREPSSIDEHSYRAQGEIAPGGMLDL
jgi:hypothetical protein